MKAVKTFQQFGRFGTVGLGINASLYLLFLGLVTLGLPPVGVSASCYLIGVALSYVLNRSWTFDSRASHSHDMPRFFMAYGLGLTVTVILMGVLTKHLAPAFSQALTIAVAALVIFLSLRIMRFGMRE